MGACDVRNIKPVLTDEQIEAIRKDVASKFIAAIAEKKSGSMSIQTLGRAIEREVLLATLDCRTCVHHHCCSLWGHPPMSQTCTNQSHYTETQRVDLSRKE